MRYPWEEIAQVWEEWFANRMSMSERDDILDFYRSRLQKARDHSDKVIKERLSFKAPNKEEMQRLSSKYTGPITKVKNKTTNDWVDQLTNTFLKED